MKIEYARVTGKGIKDGFGSENKTYDSVIAYDFEEGNLYNFNGCVTKMDKGAYLTAKNATEYLAEERNLELVFWNEE